MHKKLRKFCGFFTIIGYLLLSIYLLLAFLEIFVSSYKGDHSQLYEIMLFISLGAGASFMIKFAFEFLVAEDREKTFSSFFFIALCFYNVLSNLLKIMF